MDVQKYGQVVFDRYQDSNEKKDKKKFKYVEAKKGSIVFSWDKFCIKLSKSYVLSRWGILCHFKRWWIKLSIILKCGQKYLKC